MNAGKESPVLGVKRGSTGTKALNALITRLRADAFGSVAGNASGCPGFYVRVVGRVGAYLGVVCSFFNIAVKIEVNQASVAGVRDVHRTQSRLDQGIGEPLPQLPADKICFVSTTRHLRTK